MGCPWRHILCHELLLIIPFLADSLNGARSCRADFLNGSNHAHEFVLKVNHTNLIRVIFGFLLILLRRVESLGHMKNRSS